MTNTLLTTNCKSKEAVEKYLDDVLSKVQGDLPDPMRIPPRSTVVELSDGEVWGLSTLTRKGDANVKCEGKKVTITAKFTAEEIKGRYTWHKKLRGRDREGYVVFISEDFEAEADLSITYADDENQHHHPQLERLEISRFKDARIEMTGMSYITWALGEMTTLLSGIFQRAIAHALEGPLREALEMRMREIDID
ncbi:uncharacterized protein LOC129228563 [Uloborus diversus]|uniref:uncharacterized protein LOC129228563 n=1 Tax=Uloborus diversus TaxID=327109 RepID=UPI00240A768A|nr:uncharacterized protein LOC129228563 [Uloborus diversus]